MRIIQYISVLIIGLTSWAALYAEELEPIITKAFGEQSVLIVDYDQHLKEIVVQSKSYFATHDGRYIFSGPIFDTQREIDIVVDKENQRRKLYLQSLPREQFVRYPSTTELRYEITVFTDIDCPYCRKLHNYMDSFNQRGISVNYAMLPRAGVGSTSYKKTLTALCSDEPASAITRAMQGGQTDAKNCDSTSLDQQMDLARNLRIGSTPTVVLPNGELRVGLITPDKLIELLDGSQ